VVGFEAKREGAEDAALDGEMEKDGPTAAAVGKTGRARAAVPRPLLAKGVRRPSPVIGETVGFIQTARISVLGIC